VRIQATAKKKKKKKAAHCPGGYTSLSLSLCMALFVVRIPKIFKSYLFRLVCLSGLPAMSSKSK